MKQRSNIPHVRTQRSARKANETNFNEFRIDKSRRKTFSPHVCRRDDSDGMIDYKNSYHLDSGVF